MFLFLNFQWSTSLVPQYRPVIDGQFLPHTPEELVQSGNVNVDKILTGATMDEGLIAGECHVHVHVLDLLHM